MERGRTQKEGDDRGEYLPMSKKRDDKKSLSLLPLDLIIEILTKLPPKSVCKLICVSKLWLSIIKGKLFTDLYLARSSTRPRLLFQFSRGGGNGFFHSASQEDPSSDDRANTTPIRVPMMEVLPPIRGLICFRTYSTRVISNPSTSQFLTLPKVNTIRSFKFTFFGYDPVNDLYKVLCMTYGGSPSVSVSEEHHVFTLGGAQKTWRMIGCKHPHRPATPGLCRDGFIYYGAWTNSTRQWSSFLVSFDLTFEQFSLIALPEDRQIKFNGMTRLVNYNGKIALVGRPFIGKFECWVLEDVCKQEWSKVCVSNRSWKDLARNDLYYGFSGTIGTGELVFSPCVSTSKLFVIYYDPKKDKARRVEFQISRDVCINGGQIFLDHVESPMFLPRNFVVDD